MTLSGSHLPTYARSASGSVARSIALRLPTETSYERGTNPRRPNVHHEAAVVGFQDRRLHDLAGFLELRHPVPLTPAAGAARGEHDPAVGTLRLDHRGHDSVADCDIRSFSARFP
jgi:hypothetical protein